jgi:putative aldouronate transport system substrate-binding protein
MCGNQLISYIWQKYDPQKWEKFKQFDSRARKTKLLGFLFDEKPVQTQVQKCDTIWTKYMPMLETGKRAPDVY